MSAGQLHELRGEDERLQRRVAQGLFQPSGVERCGQTQQSFRLWPGSQGDSSVHHFPTQGIPKDNVPANGKLKSSPASDYELFPNSRMLWGLQP